jgi:hypothetical protein
VTRTEEEEKRLTRLSRLPELARLLHGLFVGEKKAVMPFDTIVEKLSYSYTGGLSQSKSLVTSFKNPCRVSLKQESHSLLFLLLFSI